jgi:hypothetical protein
MKHSPDQGKVTNLKASQSDYYFSQLLNVHNILDVRQIEVHTEEPILPGCSHLEVEIATEKLKRYKSPGSDQMPAELIFDIYFQIP